MSLVEKVRAITLEQMRELAQTIEGELKAECPVKSGEARRSIHIEEIDDTHIFVGGTNEHLFFADQGNKQKYSYFGGRRNPNAPNYQRRGSRVLKFSDGSIHTYARTYEGKHFVKEVADRHR